MIFRHESLITELTSKVIAPVIQVFAFYVIVHGHYSPGGGFQGGVMLAASIILLRIVLGHEASYRRFSPRAAIFLAAAGVLFFMLVGAVPALLGGAFLDYGLLPIPGADAAARRYIGILLVEVGIGLGIWGALVAVFDALTATDEASSS